MKKDPIREKLIQLLVDYVEKEAEKAVCTNHEIKNERVKGIWPEELTTALEISIGPCTEEHEWTDDDKSIKIGLRYRFATPCIYKKVQVGQAKEWALVEMEFVKDEVAEEWNISQITTWKDLGWKMACDMRADVFDILDELID